MDSEFKVRISNRDIEETESKKKRVNNGIFVSTILHYYSIPCGRGCSLFLTKKQLDAFSTSRTQFVDLFRKSINCIGKQGHQLNYSIKEEKKRILALFIHKLNDSPPRMASEVIDTIAEKCVTVEHSKQFEWIEGVCSHFIGDIHVNNHIQLEILSTQPLGESISTLPHAEGWIIVKADYPDEGDLDWDIPARFITTLYVDRSCAREIDAFLIENGFHLRHCCGIPLERLVPDA